MWSQIATGSIPLRAAAISAFSNSPAIGWRFKTENCRSKRELRLHCGRNQGLFMFDLGCSCDAVGGGLPWRYLAWLPPHTRAGCFSCQLSNITYKKVNAPRRGCTYGPMAYADCHEDCRNTGLNIQRGLRKVNKTFCHPLLALIQTAIELD